MIFTTSYILIAFVFTGCISAPSKINKSEETAKESKIIQHKDKKGTIRISGPWHSESALDRNIDPGEDSYVKKIISSNEGINFNKDIAEAGEVFDANGIEDFYDKNAMITYEVNGHEIPVHMKPKLTPQSKTMFPEYGRDSPETIGNTRQTKGSQSGPNISESPDGRPSTFTGLSVKDMPEYKFHDSTDLGGIIDKEEKHTPYMHNSKPVIKSNFENRLNSHVSAGNHRFSTGNNEFSPGGLSEETLARLKYFSSRLNNKQISQSAHSIEDIASEFLNKPEHKELDQPPKVLSKAILKEPAKLYEQHHEDEHRPLVIQNEPVKVENTVLEQHQTVLKDVKDSSENKHLEEVEKASHPLTNPSSEGKLFEKLQSLHDKLNKDNDVLTESQQHSSVENQNNNEPEKEKAKAKILTLLGELTSKLKGMEAVVTGHHAEKESVLSNAETKTIENKTPVELKTFESKIPIETKTPTETKAVETKVPIEKLAPVETKLTEEIKSSVDTKAPTEIKVPVESKVPLEGKTSFGTKTSFGGQPMVSDTNSIDIPKVTHSQLEPIHHDEAVEKPSASIHHDDIAEQPSAAIKTRFSTNDVESSRNQDEVTYQADKRKQMESYHRINDRDREMPFKMKDITPNDDDHVSESPNHNNELLHGDHVSESSNHNSELLHNDHVSESSNHNNELLHDDHLSESSNHNSESLNHNSESLNHNSDLLHGDHVSELSNHNSELLHSHYVSELSNHDSDLLHGDHVSALANHPSEIVSSDHVLTEATNLNHKLLPGDIEKLNEQNLPFVMNTASIDYKPEKEDAKELDSFSDQVTGTSRTTSEATTSKEEEENKLLGEETDQPIMKHRHKSFSDPQEEIHSEGESSLQIKITPKQISLDSFEDSPTSQKAPISSSDEGEDLVSEGSKAYEVAESLAAADESDRDNVARRKTFRPAIEDIEYPDYNEVKDAAIFETNLLRKRYHANKLNWSDKLSDEAQKQAEILAKKTELDINKLDTFKRPGTNLALIKINSPNVGRDATDLWEKESKNYDFRSPLVNKKNSDFVQLMWKSEKEFGLGVAKSKSGKGWIVSSYFDTPYKDEFQELKSNLQSDVPIDDPYQDIAG